MPDRFGAGVRSKIMASIRSRNTKSELLLRKLLRGMGFSYQPKLAGKPDFAHRKKKVAVFVNGCFWHKCPWHYKEPKSRKSYWVPKMKKNAARDKANVKALKKAGYKVLVFWEHELQNNLEKCIKSIRDKMTTSLLKALLNLKKYGDNDLKKIVASANPIQPRINLAGNGLDFFVRDAFCDTFSFTDSIKKMKAYMTELSYFASQNHPPDMIIRGSDAVEVKKVASINAQEIHLNSSFPKSKLKSNSTLLTKECVECEKGWKEKDIIYAIGHVIDEKVRLLTFVYGDCYAADSELYEQVREGLIEGIGTLHYPFSATNELGRLNGIDPLKITNLRIRGMWIIKTPIKLFSALIKPDLSKKIFVSAIMRAGKFESFSKEERDAVKKELYVSDVKIEDPSKPERLLDAKLISFSF